MEEPETRTCSACISRRALLRVGATAAIMITLPVGCMQSNMPPVGPITAGNVAGVRVGTIQGVDGESVLLGRDAGGLYGMTRVCTHQGQLVSILGVGAATVLHCYGHGSEFTMNGAVTTGPATQPLEHLFVELATDGTITIHADQPVAADARTPVV